jgi:hypothetical protein
MLDRLLPAAATAAMVNTYRAELARQSEHTLLGQFHRELEAGAADDILDSMRERFDEHAEAIAKARSLIDPESSGRTHPGQRGTRHGRRLADPGRAHPRYRRDRQRGPTVRPKARQLRADPRIRQQRRIPAARRGDHVLRWRQPRTRFSPVQPPRPRTPNQPVVQGAAETSFDRIGPGPRYNRWAADQWDAQHAGAQGGWVGQDGRVHENPRPTNPYREKVSAT